MTSSSFLPRTPEQAAGARSAGPAPPHDAALRKNGLVPPPAAALSDAAHDTHLSIEVEDWDVLFNAVTTTLRRIVGERPGELPEVPGHSATLAASLVQAVVLDCARSLDRLHTALKQERSQQERSHRPTP